MNENKRALTVLIADDERAARARLRRLLAGIAGTRIVGEAENGLQAMEQIRQQSPDLALLDIEMPDLSGIDVARSLGTRRTPHIIFVTAYDRYAIAAFELAALDYLLKPVRADRLRAAVERARERAGGAPSEGDAARVERLDGFPFARIVARHRDGVRVLPASELIAAEIEDRLVFVRTPAGRFLTDYTLSQLEAGLDPETFLRVHRRCLVNLGHVRELHPLGNGAWRLLLSDGSHATASRNYAPQLKRRLHR